MTGLPTTISPCLKTGFFAQIGTSRVSAFASKTAFFVQIDPTLPVLIRTTVAAASSSTDPGFREAGGCQADHP
jgi:hypothetical protein